MEKEINIVMMKNTIIDLAKEKFNNFERGNIIKTYLSESGLSIRKAADVLCIPKSTIEDWLLWTKLSKETYKRLIEKGYSKTEIYKSLRTNKTLIKKDNDFLKDKLFNQKSFFSKINVDELNEDHIKDLKEIKNIIEKIISKKVK